MSSDSLFTSNDLSGNRPSTFTEETISKAKRSIQNAKAPGIEVLQAVQHLSRYLATVMDLSGTSCSDSGSRVAWEQMRTDAEESLKIAKAKLPVGTNIDV
jgi:hypothetical protein